MLRTLLVLTALAASLTAQPSHAATGVIQVSLTVVPTCMARSGKDAGIGQAAVEARCTGGAAYRVDRAVKPAESKDARPGVERITLTF